MAFDLGVRRRSPAAEEFDDDDEDEEEESVDDECVLAPDVEPVSDLRLGVSTPMLEHVLASKANGLLLASN